MRAGRMSLLMAALAGATVATAQPLPAGVLAGGVQTYTVVRGDSLSRLGARFGVEPRALAADNAMPATARLIIGQTIVVDNRHLAPAGGGDAAIVINIPQRLLFHRASGQTVFPVAVGRRDWPTPVGSFSVVALERHPTWDVPASIAEEARQQGRELPRSVAPGPDNPLGDFWIGLSGGGIGLHGTNAPGSIYGAVTHGCIRLHPDDIASLFRHVAAGETVTTIYQPILVAEVGGRIFLEAHADIYRRGGALKDARAAAEAQGIAARVDWAAAGAAIALRHGIARDVTANNPAP